MANVRKIVETANGEQVVIRERLRTMEIGEQISFPAAVSPSVRTLASVVGFQCEMTLVTHMNRESHMIEVTRIK